MRATSDGGTGGAATARVGLRNQWFRGGARPGASSRWKDTSDRPEEGTMNARPGHRTITAATALALAAATWAAAGPLQHRPSPSPRAAASTCCPRWTRPGPTAVERCWPSPPTGWPSGPPRTPRRAARHLLGRRCRPRAGARPRGRPDSSTSTTTTSPSVTGTTRPPTATGASSPTSTPVPSPGCPASAATGPGHAGSTRQEWPSATARPPTVSPTHCGGHLRLRRRRSGSQARWHTGTARAPGPPGSTTRGIPWAPPPVVGSRQTAATTAGSTRATTGGRPGPGARGRRAS